MCAGRGECGNLTCVAKNMQAYVNVHKKPHIDAPLIELCGACGHDLKARHIELCPSCGSNPFPPRTKCDQCGTSYHHSIRFCPWCTAKADGPRRVDCISSLRNWLCLRCGELETTCSLIPVKCNACDAWLTHAPQVSQCRSCKKPVSIVRQGPCPNCGKNPDVCYWQCTQCNRKCEEQDFPYVTKTTWIGTTYSERSRICQSCITQNPKPAPSPPSDMEKLGRAIGKGLPVVGEGLRGVVVVIGIILGLLWFCYLAFWYLAGNAPPPQGPLPPMPWQ